MKKIFALVSIIGICNLAIAQQRISKSELSAFNKNLEDNPLLSDADEDFKNNTSASKWSNESAVILCQKTTFDFDKQGVSVGKRISRNFWGLVFAMPTLGTSIYAANAFNSTKILVEETERRKILLNDKFAVDLYSILYFRLFNEGDAFTARVIKKDGSVQKIDVTDAVKVEDISSVPGLFRSYTDDRISTTYRPRFYKLAVSDLEEGDIVEYEFKNFNTKSYARNPDYKEFDPVYYLCNRTMPVAKQVIEVIAQDEKYYLGYKSLKGAPDFVQTTSNGKRIYRWSDNNRERITDTRYVNEFMELPSIKFQMIYARNNSKSLIWFKDAEDMKNDLADEELAEKVKLFLFEPAKLQQTGNYSAGLSDGVDGTVKDIYKTLKKKGLTDATDEDFVRKAYYLIRSQTLYNNWSDYAFVRILSGVLKEKKIEHEIVVSTYNTRTTLNKLAFTQELAWMVKYKNHYYINPDEHLNPEELPSYLSGNKAMRFNYADQKAAVEKEILPITDTLQNAMITQITSSLDIAGSTMTVAKTVEAKGDVKSDMIDEVLALTPFMETDYRNYDGVGMWEGMGRNEEKLTSEFNQQKKEWKEEKPEMMKALASGLYNHTVDKYTNFRLVQDGRSHKKRSLKYEENFVINDVKATAGEDMLVEIPALVGAQTRLKKEERARTLPVDLRYPRTLIWNITFAIPAGYTPKGLESLNKTITNECGSFTSVAVVENNNLLLKVRKVYNVRSFDTQRWPLLLSIQDAAYAFSQSKLLLKKI
jgi:hypothetical protein